MIRYDYPQGSQEWVDAHLGIPTSSQFARIITPATAKPSSQAEAFMHELIAERIMGAPVGDYMSSWMERGLELEDQAVAWYELQHDIDTDKVGFCLTDDKRMGCSPDRLVGLEGGLEIKTPAAHTHIAWSLKPPTKYRCQIQGNLMITGRQWWDFVSWNPELKPVVVRYERDDEFIEKLRSAVVKFCDMLEATAEKAMASQ